MYVGAGSCTFSLFDPDAFSALPHALSGAIRLLSYWLQHTDKAEEAGGPRLCLKELPLRHCPCLWMLTNAASGLFPCYWCIRLLWTRSGLSIVRTCTSRCLRTMAQAQSGTTENAHLRRRQP